jgi:hypothetical protein
MTIADIVTSIDQRLTQAKAEIAQLDGARQALINGAATTHKPQRRRAQRTPARTVYAVVAAGKLTALLDGSSGMSTPQLA